MYFTTGKISKLTNFSERTRTKENGKKGFIFRVWAPHAEDGIRRRRLQRLESRVARYGTPVSTERRFELFIAAIEKLYDI